MNEPNSIPGLPHRFFKWYCRADRYEELHGDLEEYFYERVKESGMRVARFRYWLDVIRCCRSYALKRQLTPNNPGLMMLTNYFKVSARGLMKNPLNSFINVFGLSTAIGICVFLYAFAHWTYSTDQFHKNKDVVYLVTFKANRDGSLQQYGKTPEPLGEMLQEDFVHIKKVCRVEDKSVVMKYDDRVFHELVRFADPEFLEMLTFPLKWGAARSLADINSIILSETMSIKYFGEENPIGQSILLKWDNETGKAFKITGVAKEFPDARTIDFDFLVNFNNLHVFNPQDNFDDWRKFVNGTMVQVDNAADLNSLKAGMTKYKILQNKAAEDDWAITSFQFEQLATLHRQSGHIKDDISQSSDFNYETVNYLIVIGILMLALACFNYINIAIVTAARRLKEIGVRKTIGATRSIVIVQFLAENIVITFFALIFGVILAATVFIPGFEQLWDFRMGFTLFDVSLWIYLPLIMLLTAIASGIYPAVYISRFEVINILKGSAQFGRKNGLTKVFLGVQLVLACIFLTAAVMGAQNTSYVTHRNWGYNQASVVYTDVPDLAAFEKLNAAMTRNADVVSVSGSVHHLGKNNTTAVVHILDRQYEVEELLVDANYFETMGLQLKEGRGFKDHYESDRHNVVVNEAFAKGLALDNAVGLRFKIDSVEYEVIGVIRDFHNRSFKNKVLPAFFGLADRNNYQYIAIRTRAGSEKETFLALQTEWAKRFPETPFQGGFQEDVWGNYFTAVGIYETVMKVFATIAVLLASLGLYGLVSLNVVGRIREFSIRKVLGAGVSSIASVITRQYLVLFSVALIVAAPISFTLIKLLITTSDPYHMPIDYSGVAIALGILVFILLVIISTQVGKVTRANPVAGLKIE